MTDERRERGQNTAPSNPAKQDTPASDKHRSKTEGTNRDFDDRRESANQGHGHPREEREQEGR